jgi:hypothetical protein
MSRMGDKIMAMFPEGNLPGHPPGIVPEDVVYAYQENPDWDAEDIKRYVDWTNRPDAPEDGR